MKVKSPIHIKFGNDDPTSSVLMEAMENINEYLSYYQKLSNPRISGKYIYYDLEHSDLWDNSNYVGGMLSGYLMAKGVEII